MEEYSEYEFNKINRNCWFNRMKKKGVTASGNDQAAD